jgi:hypothetical protein
MNLPSTHMTCKTSQTPLFITQQKLNSLAPSLLSLTSQQQQQHKPQNSSFCLIMNFVPILPPPLKLVENPSVTQESLRPLQIHQTSKPHMMQNNNTHHTTFFNTQWYCMQSKFRDKLYCFLSQKSSYIYPYPQLKPSSNHLPIFRAKVRVSKAQILNFGLKFVGLCERLQ